MLPLDPQASESELWQRLRSGDRAAFEAIVRANHHCLRRFAGAFLGDPAEGDDVAQRALLDVWLDRGGLPPPTSLRAHLLTRVRHLCWTRVRSRKRARRWLAAAAEQPADAVPTPLDHLVASDSAQDAAALSVRVAALVNGLEDDARTILWMRFAGEASFEEIGAAVGRPSHAVRAVAYRQLALLRKRLLEVEG